MYDFHKFSLNQLEIEPDTEVMLLVITRWDSQDKRQSIRHMINNSQGWSAVHTLMPVYHMHCHKPVFRPKMAIFQRAGMREGFCHLESQIYVCCEKILIVC